MTIGNTIARILIAAIPVTAMLFIEGVLSRRRHRRDVSSRRIESDQTRRDAPRLAPASQLASLGGYASTDQDQTRRDVASTKRQQDDRYFQTLYRTAQSGSLSAMNKLGEFAFIRRNFVEACYWKLMLELRHGRPSGLPAQGVCRFWYDVGCPEPTADEGGSFTDSQSRLAMAVLDLWSGRHVHTPKETIRQMVKEGDKDALLCAKRLGIGHVRP